MIWWFDGSRDVSDYGLLKATLDQLAAEYEFRALISGTAKGADTLGETYAAERNIPIARCPADWKRYGRGAGPQRNEQMAQLATQDNALGVLVAFWNGTSSGTKHMIATARAHGLKTEVISVGSSVDGQSDS